MVRVLIIDDQAHVRAAISLTLQAKGYETVGANSGATGLREFDHSKFDLAIIDIYMPGIDGVKVIKMLRQRAADLPIVAISGAFGGRFLLARRCSAPALLWASRSAATTC